MHAGNDDNDVTVNTIEQSVGKSMDQRPSGIAMNDRVHGWMSSNAVARGLHGRQELITQARTLALVPYECLINVRSSRRTNNDWHHWVRLRIR